jgi:hypothetical protein
MAFAIYYNLADLTPLVALAQAQASFTNAEKQLAGKIWNGGLRDWDKASNLVGASDPHAGGDPDCRRVVINAQGVTLADFIGLCRTVGNRVPGAIFLDAIASDLQTTAVEPWP